jgi:hypothetical protein
MATPDRRPPGTELGQPERQRRSLFLARPYLALPWFKKPSSSWIAGRSLFQWDHRGNVDLDNHARPSELADGEERMGAHRGRSERFLAALAKIRLISHVS